MANEAVRDAETLKVRSGSHAFTAAAPDFLTQLDTNVFKIESQSSQADKVSFLRLQATISETFSQYVYLEIGSHMGGTLLPYLLDVNCDKAISIDLRPESQKDERGRRFYYATDAEAEMLTRLKEAAGDLTLKKVSTFNCDIKDLDPKALPTVHIALVDGEHTNAACFSDADCLLNVMNPDSILAFHDANLVIDAILNFERMLSRMKIEHFLRFLPDCVAAIGLGKMAETVRDKFAAVGLDRAEYVASSQTSRWKAIAFAMAQHEDPNLRREILKHSLRAGIKFRLATLRRMLSRD
jgi:hypothetical protein